MHNATRGAAARRVMDDASLDARLDAVERRCRRLATQRALLAAGVAVVPIPGIDWVTDIGVLLKALPEVNAAFGLTPAEGGGPRPFADRRTREAVRVALDVPLEQAFDFLVPEGLDPVRGSLVVVPFGRTAKVGVVTGRATRSDVPADRLREIALNYAFMIQQVAPEAAVVP